MVEFIFAQIDLMWWRCFFLHFFFASVDGHGTACKIYRASVSRELHLMFSIRIVCFFSCLFPSIQFWVHCAQQFKECKKKLKRLPFLDDNTKDLHLLACMHAVNSVPLEFKRCGNQLDTSQSHLFRAYSIISDFVVVVVLVTPPKLSATQTHTHILGMINKTVRKEQQPRWKVYALHIFKTLITLFRE